MSEVGDLDAIYDRPFRYSWKEGRAGSTQESFLSQREVEILSELNTVLDPLIYSIQSVEEAGKTIVPAFTPGKLGLETRSVISRSPLYATLHSLARSSVDSRSSPREEK